MFATLKFSDTITTVIKVKVCLLAIKNQGHVCDNNEECIMQISWWDGDGLKSLGVESWDILGVADT